MKNLYICLFLLFLISPAFAETWFNIPGTTINYNKDSIKNESNAIFSVLTKSPANDGLELRNTVHINCLTKQFNFGELKLFDPLKQKYVYRQYIQPDWTDIPDKSNMYWLYLEVCK